MAGHTQMIAVALALSWVIGGACLSPIHLGAVGLPSRVVTDCGNFSGPGTLYDAVNNLQPVGGGAVTFACASGTGTIMFPHPLVIDANITIDARASTTRITFDGGHQSILFQVLSTGALTIDDVVLTNGHTTASQGGAITNSYGRLTLRDCTVSFNDNTQYGGGALLIEGGSTFIDRCTFNNNTGVYGGVIENGSGDSSHPLQLTITNSTFVANYAAGYGGAIASYTTALVINSTFSGNQAFLGGGTLQGAQVLGNYQPLTVVNSVLAGGAASTLCFQTITDGGGNIADDASCGFGAHSLNATNPRLDGAGLLDHGGFAKTVALLPDSPALGFSSASCPATDERGVLRLPGVNCDGGAYENKFITGVTPQGIQLAGGSVTITGIGLNGPVYVQFGNQAPIAATATNGAVTIVAPGGPPGYVPVTITVGTLSETLPHTFGYTGSMPVQHTTGQVAVGMPQQQPVMHPPNTAQGGINPMPAPQPMRR